MAIAPREIPPQSAVQAVLLTSANAVIPGLPDARVLAVGDATAARARAAGFTDVQSAGRDAAALAVLVEQTCRPAAGPLLLASGEGQGMALATQLRGGGLSGAADRRLQRPASAGPARGGA